MKDRYLKKRPRELDIDGDKFYVRSMTLGEAQQSEELAKTPETTLEAVRYTLSCICVDQNGVAVFESASDPAIGEIPMEVANRLIVAGRDVSSPPAPGKVLKNSSATP